MTVDPRERSNKKNRTETNSPVAGRNSPPRHHNRRRAQLRSSVRLSTHRSRWQRRQHQQFRLSKRAIKMDPKAPLFFNQMQPCAAPQSSSSSSKSFPLSASTFVSSVLIPQPLLLIRAATKPQRGSPIAASAIGSAAATKDISAMAGISPPRRMLAWRGRKHRRKHGSNLDEHSRSDDPGMFGNTPATIRNSICEPEVALAAGTEAK